MLSITCISDNERPLPWSSTALVAFTSRLKTSLFWLIYFDCEFSSCFASFHLYIYSEKHTGWICKSAAKIRSGFNNSAIWGYTLSIKYPAAFRKLTALGLSRSWNFWRIPLFEKWPHIEHHKFAWLVDGLGPDRGIIIDLWEIQKKDWECLTYFSAWYGYTLSFTYTKLENPLSYCLFFFLVTIPVQ